MLGKKIIGLDIADKTIELVRLKKEQDNFVVLSSKKVDIDDGIVSRGRIVNEKKLLEALKKLFAGAKPIRLSIADKIVFGIPDALSFLHIFEIENNKENIENIAELIRNEIKQSIPEDISNLAYDHKTLKRDKKKIQILVGMVNDEAFSEWQQFFKKNKFNIVGYDFESQANYSGIARKKAKTPICLIDIGYSTSKINIFNESGIEFSSVSYVSGQSFTQIYMDTQSIDFKSAENEKKEKGLVSKPAKTHSAISKQIDKLVVEINQLIGFCETSTKEKVGQIVLMGGGAKLKGLEEYIQKKTKLSVTTAKPSIVNAKFDTRYITAIGLAKRWIMKHKNIFKLNTTSENSRKEKVRDVRRVLSKNQKTMRIIGRNDMPDEAKSRDQIQQEQSRAKLLLALLGFCVFILIGVIMFNIGKNEEDQSIIIGAFQHEQKLELEIPLAIRASEYTPDRIRGRIIKYEIEDQINTEEKERFYARAIAEVKKGEYLLSEPIFLTEKVETADDVDISEAEMKLDTIMMKKKIGWLAFNTKEVDGFAIKQIKNKLKKTKFVLNSIEYNGFEKTDNENIYKIIVGVSIGTEDLVSF